MPQAVIRPELLAPAGDMAKLKTALHFGADAVYVGGSAFGLRAAAANFGEKEMPEAVKYAHSAGRKLYVAVNVFAVNGDFPELREYLRFLNECGADAAIVTDPGVFEACRKYAPDMDVHISTQANVTNKYAAKFWASLGAKRIVLARETPLCDIREIYEYLDGAAEIEAFVHGAMCVSYSGRCLLSAALSGRSANRGNCAQPCRWEYELTEVNRKGERYPIYEDGRGTYIMNSGDLCMLGHLGELAEAGVASFKIEGRMKSQYYVASVVSAYRRALDAYIADPEGELPAHALAEADKTAHRAYTTGFYFGSDRAKVSSDASQTEGGYDFVAAVKGYDASRGYADVEQRNAFSEGEELEVLSAGDADGRTFVVTEMYDSLGERVKDAKLVQQRLRIAVPFALEEWDILRRKKKNA